MIDPDLALLALDMDFEADSADIEGVYLAFCLRIDPPGELRETLGDEKWKGSDRER